MELQRQEQEESELDLDISWIGEQERILSIQKGVSKEPMKQVDLVFLYLNKHKYIEKIVKEFVDLQFVEGVKGTVLSKDEVLRFIQLKKIYTATSKYKFREILQFVVPIESAFLQSFSMEENPQISFSKVLSHPYEDIVFPESIFVFHKTNSLFFVYEEVDLHSRRHTVRSILKKDGTLYGTDKKVKIVGRTTRKNMNNL